MNVSSDSSDSDSDGPVKVGREALPEKTNFYFLETGKSKGEGVLITHNDTFKFTKINVNRNARCIIMHVYKVRQNYDLGCQKKLKNLNLLENGGFLSKITHFGVNEI